MKTRATHTRPRPLQHLLALSLLLLTAAPALAEETLRYALVATGNYPLLCDDVRNAPADFFQTTVPDAAKSRYHTGFFRAPGWQAIASDGSARYVSFVGTVSIEGKQQVELRGLLGKPERESLDDGPDPGVSFMIARVPGVFPAAFVVDSEILSAHSSYYGARGSRVTCRSRVPARPNAWQEVMTWGRGHLSLWQYYTPAEGQVPSAPDTSDKIVPVYRLEVLLGQFSKEALDKLPSSDPEHRRLIAEVGRWRQTFSTHVSPEVPFHSGTSYFEYKKLKDANHEPSGVDWLAGTLVQNPSHLVLKLQYTCPALKNQDRRVTAMGAEMGTDEWHFQRIENPPPAGYEVEGSGCDTSWGERSLGAPCINVAAYRLTKVSPAEGDHPQP